MLIPAFLLQCIYLPIIGAALRQYSKISALPKADRSLTRVKYYEGLMSHDSDGMTKWATQKLTDDFLKCRVINPDYSIRRESFFVFGWTQLIVILSLRNSISANRNVKAVIQGAFLLKVIVHENN